MKQHLLGHFEKSAAHHLALGKAHHAIADAHTAISGHLGEDSEEHRALSRAHGEAASLHADRAAHYIKLYKAIEGARGDDVPSRITDRGDLDGGDLNGPRKAMASNPWGNDVHKLAPTRVAGVLPDNPSLRLVGRPGGPPVPEQGDVTDRLDELLK